MSNAPSPNSGTIVQEEQLTTRDHIDPDKHWIGESLPAASDEDTTYSGITTSAGTSPFPAVLIIPMTIALHMAYIFHQAIK